MDIGPGDYKDIFIWIADSVNGGRHRLPGTDEFRRTNSVFTRVSLLLDSVNELYLVFEGDIVNPEVKRNGIETFFILTLREETGIINDGIDVHFPAPPSQSAGDPRKRE